MKINKLGRNVVIAVIVAAVFFISGALWKGGSRESVPVITSSLLSEKLVSINELATVDYSYTNMGKFEDVTDFYGWKVPFTKKRFIISYNGDIKAGIDMKKVKVDVKGNRITIKLPKAEILAHQIDNSSLKIFDETSYVFNPLKLNDYTTFVEKETKKMEDKAIKNGLLEEAQDKAQNAIKDVVDLFSSKDRSYTIKFEN